MTTPRLKLVYIYLIKQVVCRKYNVSIDRLASPPKRKAKKCEAMARQAVTYLIREKTGIKFETIAKELNYESVSMAKRNYDKQASVISVDQEEKVLIEECAHEFDCMINQPKKKVYNYTVTIKQGNLFKKNQIKNRWQILK